MERIDKWKRRGSVLFGVMQCVERLLD